MHPLWSFLILLPGLLLLGWLMVLQLSTGRFGPARWGLLAMMVVLAVVNLSGRTAGVVWTLGLALALAAGFGVWKQSRVAFHELQAARAQAESRTGRPAS